MDVLSYVKRIFTPTQKHHWQSAAKRKHLNVHLWPRGSLPLGMTDRRSVQKCWVHRPSPWTIVTVRSCDDSRRVAGHQPWPLNCINSVNPCIASEWMTDWCWRWVGSPCLELWLATRATQEGHSTGTEHQTLHQTHKSSQKQGVPSCFWVFFINMANSLLSTLVRSFKGCSSLWRSMIKLTSTQWESISWMFARVVFNPHYSRPWVWARPLHICDC